MERMMENYSYNMFRFVVIIVIPPSKIPCTSPRSEPGE